MDDVIQIKAGLDLLRVAAEYQRRESPAFNFSAIVKNLVAESPANLLLDVWMCECLVTCRIGVDDPDIRMSGQFVRDGRLSRSDSANHSNHHCTPARHGHAQETRSAWLKFTGNGDAGARGQAIGRGQVRSRQA